MIDPSLLALVGVPILGPIVAYLFVMVERKDKAFQQLVEKCAAADKELAGAMRGLERAVDDLGTWLRDRR